MRLLIRNRLIRIYSVCPLVFEFSTLFSKFFEIFRLLFGALRVKLYKTPQKLVILQDTVTNERAKQILTRDGEMKVTFTATVGLDNYYMQYEVKVGAYNIHGDGPNSSVKVIYSAEGSELISSSFATKMF